MANNSHTPLTGDRLVANNSHAPLTGDRHHQCCLRLSLTRRRGSTTCRGCCPCRWCAAKYFPAGINQGLAAASAVPPVSGPLIALVIQIPAVSAMGEATHSKLARPTSSICNIPIFVIPTSSWPAMHLNYIPTTISDFTFSFNQTWHAAKSTNQLTFYFQLFRERRQYFDLNLTANPLIVQENN